ncbi:leucine-rich repeat-containing protein 52-like [Heterodontus francisci]|uniref:leucine-rich repeat-containing protein 52-like n=1 Tax=Heterodontus francisci TaxID=7792 RepID=UPI00355B224F
MGVLLAADCPPNCTCQQFIVNCRGKNLKAFPKHVSLNTRHLDIASNSITEINSLELNLLSDLVHLDCSNNKISEISKLDFLGVVKLVYLDLSSNHLQRIARTTFEPLDKLIILKLSHNPELREIEDGAFATNVGLREINLSNNNLSFLNTTSLRSLQGLKTIYLAGNPWECQCTIAVLSGWMFENNSTFPDGANTFCVLPKSMAGISVSKALSKLFDICHTPLDYFDYLFFVVVSFAIFISGIIVASLAGAIMVCVERQRKFTEDEDKIEMQQYKPKRSIVRNTNIKT